VNITTSPRAPFLSSDLQIAILSCLSLVPELPVTGGVSKRKRMKTLSSGPDEAALLP
jgi:hypothetical protein